MSDYIENNKYLGDNGRVAGTFNLSTSIETFITNRIGIRASVNINNVDPIDPVQYIYGTEEDAVEAAFSASENYVGTGILGIRTRNITAQIDPNGSTKWAFISNVLDPTEPNFWSDLADINEKILNLKTDFLNDLSTLNNKLINYKKIIENINKSLIKIFNKENESFPSIYNNSDNSGDNIYNDVNNTSTLLTALEANLTNINNMYDFFLNDAVGTESSFNTNLIS